MNQFRLKKVRFFHEFVNNFLFFKYVCLIRKYSKYSVNLIFCQECNDTPFLIISCKRNCKNYIFMWKNLWQVFLVKNFLKKRYSREAVHSLFKRTNDFNEYLIPGDTWGISMISMMKTVKMTNVVFCKKVAINYCKNDHISNSSSTQIKKCSIQNYFNWKILIYSFSISFFIMDFSFLFKNL